MEIVGPRDHRVKATLLLLLAGCFWRSYPSLATTHAELLVAMARKGSDLVSSGRFGAENMPELTYPLERADAFAHTARARAGSAPPPSLAAFEELLARYRAFIDALDQTRRADRGDEARTALAPPLAAVEAAAATVRTALASERGG